MKTNSAFFLATLLSCAMSIAQGPISAPLTTPHNKRLQPIPAAWNQLANPPIEVYVDGSLDLLTGSGIEIQHVLDWIMDRVEAQSLLGPAEVSLLKSDVTHFRFGCSRLNIERADEQGMPVEFRAPELFYLRLFFRVDSVLFEHLKDQLDPEIRDHFFIHGRTIFPVTDLMLNSEKRKIPLMLISAGANRSIVFGTPAFFVDKTRSFSRNLRIGLGLLDSKRGLAVIADTSHFGFDSDFVAASLGTESNSCCIAVNNKHASGILAQLQQFKSTSIEEPTAVQAGLVTQGALTPDAATAIVDFSKAVSLTQNGPVVTLKAPSNQANHINLILAIVAGGQD